MAVTVSLFIAMLIAIVVNAEGFYHVLNELVMKNLMWGTGWVSSVASLFMVILCIYIMCSKMGDIKLGGPNATP